MHSLFLGWTADTPPNLGISERLGTDQVYGYTRRGPPLRIITHVKLDSSSRCIISVFGGSMYVEEMYAAWKADPKSVHKSWDVYFRHTDSGRGGSTVSRRLVESNAHQLRTVNDLRAEERVRLPPEYCPQHNTISSF